MELDDNYDSMVKSAVDEWLRGNYTDFSVRREWIPEEIIPWVYEAAKVGAAAVIEDKVEGLMSDLDAAIEVVWSRGAHDWVKMNYPMHYQRLLKASGDDERLW